MRTHTAVLIRDGKVAETGPASQLKPEGATVIDLGDATLLPGFIELHAHLTYKKVPEDTVLRHGITTLRDVGGPVHPPRGGNGTLRVMTSGPILTAPQGYPIPALGTANIAIPIHNEGEARKTVRDLIAKGAVVIKIALEPGGEHRAPWSMHHAHGHGHATPASHQEKADHTHKAKTPHTGPHSSQHSSHTPASSHWPLLPESVVKAIVDEAHRHNRSVTAHVGEERGVRIALAAGVDEWAHMPCDPIPESLLKQAVAQNVTIVSTLDTLSKCTGIQQNAKMWKALGGSLLYGAEIAHPDIPWGIDGQELLYLMQWAGKNPMEILRAATSHSGKHLGVPLLGTLEPGAPADLIAVKGNPLHGLKALEYPDLVISGGHVVVNRF
ncbi:imidazolonepropionase-like amidohydrolase [Nitrospina gracilis]|uniref:amidohydrolase family protein n=1 Tax=Nitrospina TaxID=35800 RepID=UPI00034A48C4|nr:amidohydrolase family protein [Nitrospina gracilis]MCF8722300.1 imidazolonepropionase-like amidohydrolase [Nitrospina sp. Nb-3]